MKTPPIRLLAFVLLCLFSCAVVAQVTTGTPPLGSFSSGPDVTNLGNLNVHFAIPVINKPGRGMPFFYNLDFDSSVWSPVSSSGTASWTPIANWGWRGETDAVVGYVVFASWTTSCRSDDGTTQHYTVYSFQSYVDEFGTTHNIDGHTDTKDQANCVSGGGTPTGQVTALDGSGLTVNLTNDPAATVIARDGSMFSPPLASGPFAGSITDRNGNRITTTNGATFTDTLGMTALSVSGSNPKNFTYTDTSGTARSVSINYSTYTVQTNFGCSGVSEYGPIATTLVSSVALPDGSSYSFTYEQTPGGPSGYVTGRVKSITLRTGATITYAYTGSNNGIICADGSPAGFNRTTSDGTTMYARNGSQTSWTTTVTDAQNNKTVINFQTATPPLGGAPNFYETHRTVNQGSSTVLRQTDTCYQNIAPPCTNTAITLPIPALNRYTTLDNNQIALSAANLNSVGLPTSTGTYDFGNAPYGAQITSSTITYASLGNGILGQPATITVFDGGGAQIAQTTFGYDASAPTATSGVPQHSAITGSRGNPTSVSQWLNTTNSNLTTTLTYDDTGNVLTSTDPGGHETQLSYADNFADGINRNSLAYLTQLTMPVTGSVNHVTKAQYDANTGLPVNTWDQNNQKTSTTYDSMLRPLQVNAPDGGNTTFIYLNPNQTDVQQKMTSAANAYQATQFDGYGRVSRVARENGESNPWDQQDFCYDSNGRLGFQSYAYQGSGWGTTKVCSGSGDSFTYDALGRPLTVTHTDGTNVSSAQSTYSGRAQQVTDEGNGTSSVSRVLQSDALGRLTAACEVYSGNALLGSGGTSGVCNLDIGANGFLTSYGYDALGNLKTITQGSLAQRTYSYDSLSRMTSETTPEAGTLTYTYTADSLLYTRVRPAPNQADPTKQITTTYAYDPLHRLTDRTYTTNDGVNAPVNTPGAHFKYDTDPNWGNPLSNLVGRVSEAYTDAANAAQVFGYDAVGRLITNDQCTPSNCGTSAWRLSYSYDSLGNMTSSKNGVAGVIFNYNYNIAGRLTQMTSSLSDATHPDTLLTGVHYSPTAITDVLGNGVAENTSFSARGLLQSQQALSPTGQAATASVPVNGQLNGGPAPNAAAATAITSFVDNSGIQHWAYLGANQHIYHVFWSSSTGWGDQDLTAATGAPVAVAGSALSSLVDQGGTDHILFLGTNQHVYQLYAFPGSAFSFEDRTAAASAPNAAAGSALTALLDQNGGQHFTYLGSNGHLQDAYWSGGYGYRDLTVAASAPVAGAGSPLSSYLVAGQWQWYYLDNNGHLDHIICTSNTGACGYEDITLATGAPVPASGSRITTFADSNLGSHAAFVGANQHLYQAYWTGGFGYQDLTAAAGAPLAASGTAVSSYQVSTQWQWFYYGTNSHMYHILCDSGGGGCSYQDVTSSSGAPVPAAGSPLTAFVETNGGQHWGFVSGNQHVNEAYWTGNWGYQDLSTATAGQPVDSGIVTLAVGPFSATACFGSTTNSACSGQPQNNTATAVAAALASSLNTSSSPVTATVSGSTLNLTWKEPGPFTLAIPALNTTHDQPNLFAYPSFTTAATNFNGGSSGSAAYSYTLGLAPDGQITSANDTANGNWVYGYDQFNRLVSSNKNSGQQAFSYVYDRYGNRWQENLTAGTGPNSQYTFDTNNHFLTGITGLMYDVLGNVTNDGFHSYTYDDESRVIQVDGSQSLSYVYDALGRRVSGPNGQYLYDASGHMITQLSSTGGWNFGEIYAGARHIATYSGGTTYFTHRDWVGTNRAITGMNGAIYQTCTGLPWGESPACNTVTYSGFTDMTYDSEIPSSDLYHTLFRKYTGNQGRWLTPDPGGLATANIRNPQSLNRYAYVINNPTNFRDPLGLFYSTKELLSGDDDEGGDGGGDWVDLCFFTGCGGGGGGGTGGGGGGGGGGSRGNPGTPAGTPTSTCDLKPGESGPPAPGCGPPPLPPPIPTACCDLPLPQPMNWDHVITTIGCLLAPPGFAQELAEIKNGTQTPADTDHPEGPGAVFIPNSNSTKNGGYGTVGNANGVAAGNGAVVAAQEAANAVYCLSQ